MRRLAIIAFVVVLAGCAAPQAGDATLGGTIGEVDGVTHDENIPITPADGFNESELDALVRRSMARVEVVRDREFERMVDVEVITRGEYRERRGNRSVGETESQWDNQVWEGLFIVGEDRDVTAVFDETFGTAVRGYYLPGEDRIVVVSDSPTPTVRKDTLVHELVHALQDQQFGLDERPPTRDEQMARNSVVEGEASLVPELYLDRCGAEWSCVRPSTGAPSGSIDPDIYRVIIQPYDQGQTFVERIRDRGGWEAIDDLHSQYPDSTEQVLHRGRYPDEKPIEVNVSDRSGSEWSRLDHDPVGERLGEATIFSMLAANDVIETDQQRRYRHPVSAGWGGDRLVPYRSEAGEFGYVWEIVWDSRGDAEAFHDVYLDVLEGHDAVTRGAGRYVIPDGPFADAFRVSLDGRTVRIVNAPTIQELKKLHPSGRN